jgi:hypothetical protein
VSSAKAAQRESGGRWDYTVEVNGKAEPAGYCAGWREVTAADEARAPGLLRDQEKFLRPHQAKFHKDGHATLEEACACFRGYLLDTTRRATSKELHPCDFPGCLCRTDAGVVVDGELRWKLCKPHRTREAFEQLMPPVGETFGAE